MYLVCSLYLTLFIAFHNINCVNGRHENVFHWERKATEQAGKHTHPGAASCIVSTANRVDCYPDGPTDPQKCKARNCCWKPALERGNVKGIPWCFFPVSPTGGYNVTGRTNTTLGFSATLKRADRSLWPDDVMTLKLDVMYEETTRLHFKIYDPAKKRYEVPIETPKVSARTPNTDYRVDVNDSPFSIKVTRSSSGTVIFDSSASVLTFANQFIEIGTILPTSYLYGLGEHRQPLRIDPSTNPRLAFWARDQPPDTNVNLYGDHAFYVGLETNGDAYGVFLLNSNAIEVNMQMSPSAVLNYVITGGILDFYVFTGPSPNDVIKQYLDVIGYSFMPPYWSLGFHLCRWGYKTSDGLRKVISRMREAKMPYDTQWMDIDYMNKHLDWTFDQKNFAGLPDIVNDLHAHGQHNVLIVDPGISSTQPTGTYLPYDDGLKNDVFIKKSDGSGPIIGEVWPGKTAYPDFTNPVTVDYWRRMAQNFHDVLPFDGLWTDMNEPSNFKFGSVEGCPANNSLDNPPYVPAIPNGKLPDRTLCPSSQQHLSHHYNLHSMYGHFEGIATHKALVSIRKNRTLIISRSTFPSSGRVMGHWTGDNNANWDNLYYSIPAILRFNMFGIPLVGADVCGFGGDTTEELCVRWMQLGAFYPFMRNHNSIGEKDQDPASPNFSSEGQDNMRLALVIRYTFLPYLYTLFYHSHANGSMVAQPLFFKYPKDNQTFSIDKQFMWGSGLLISPVLEQGKTTVDAYFPVDAWYAFYSGIRVKETGRWVTLDAPLNIINVHLSGGSIIPIQMANVTTTLSRLNPFSLLVAPDLNGNSYGELFWDDGDTIDTIENGLYNFITFNGSNGHLVARVDKMGYPQAKMDLNTVEIYAVNKEPSSVLVNGNAVQFTYLEANKVLIVSGIKISLLSAFTVTWS